MGNSGSSKSSSAPQSSKKAPPPDYLGKRAPKSTQASSSQGRFTFDVDPVKNSQKRLPTLETKEWVMEHITTAQQTKFALEAAWTPARPLVQAAPVNHLFLSAVHTAYSEHLPLVISPDDIWQCIAQGLAIHVNENAEKLRSLFVAHEGKTGIDVRKDEFHKGGDNDWASVFGEFSSQIQTHIGDENHTLIVADFSTSTPVTKIASEIVLMMAMQNYFSYSITSSCGIPSITLLGTSADYERIMSRVQTIGSKIPELLEWTRSVHAIMDLFSDAAGTHHTAREFWQNFLKIAGGSGGPYVSGWINILFPYLYSEEKKKYYRNSFATLDTFTPPVGAQFGGCGVNTSEFPAGYVHAPFVWKHFDSEFQMDFVGGFLGVSQDPETGAVCSEIGWAVLERL